MTEPDYSGYRLFAAEMRNEAYCPYSGYKVGCVILAENEEGQPYLFIGTNVENASYGLTICAERNAIFQAVSNGYKKIKRLCCATEDGNGSSCGACRQVIFEFADADTVLEYVDKDGSLVNSYTVEELLPHAFGPQRLRK